MNIILPNKKTVLSEESLAPSPTFWSINNLYELIAAAYSRDDQPKFRDDLISRPLIIELVKLYGYDKEIIDLGCGDGHISRLISPHVRKVLGIDLSKAMLAQARLKSLPFENLTFQRANFLDLPVAYSRQGFDVALGIFAFCCIKNVNQLNWAFRSVYRALKKNGIAIIQVPDEREQLSESKSEWIKETPFLLDDVTKLISRSLKTVDGKWVHVARYHYRQKDYLESMLKAGFQVQEILIPKANTELLAHHSSLKHEAEIATSTIFILKK